MKKKNSIYSGLRALLILILIGLARCAGNDEGIKKEYWGKVQNKQVYLYTVKNASGMVVKITNYGGIITSVLVPDRNGKMEDVVLGFDNLQQYLDPLRSAFRLLSGDPVFPQQP